MEYCEVDSYSQRMLDSAKATDIMNECSSNVQYSKSGCVSVCD